MQTRDLRNTAFNVAGELLWGFQANLVASATVLTVFLREYGANARMIGAIAAIETAAFLLPQGLAVYLFRSPRRRKAHLVAFHLLTVIPFLFLMAGVAALAPGLEAGAPSGQRALSPELLCWALLAGWAGHVISCGVVLAAWNDWWASVFDRSIRGTVMGASMAASALAGTGGALVAGWLLRTSQHPRVYVVLYALAGALAAVSICVFLCIRDPAEQGPDSDLGMSLPSLLARFRESLRNANFRAFLIGRILAAAGFGIVPFIAVRFTSASGGGLSGGTVVSCGAGMTAAMAASSLVLGRLGDRHGHRTGMLIGAGTQVAALLVLLLCRGWVGCVLAYAGAGVCMGVGWVSHYNMLFETCPHDSRLAHITVGNLILGLTTAAAPLLAGAVAERWGLNVLFTVCLAVSVGALLWFLMRVRDPRSIPVRAGS